MKLYSVDIRVPYIWRDEPEKEQAHYDSETAKFRDNKHFKVAPGIDDNNRQPVEVLTQLWTSEELIELSLAGIQYDNVKEVKDLTELLASQEPSAQPRENYYNERVNVHVPGLALLTYNRTMLLEDCCTDYLQEMLDDGWRIIAVSPQPDQRRPDYILGRYVQE